MHRAGEVRRVQAKRRGLVGEVEVPGDKSITHRAGMFGAVADGVSSVRTSALGRDNFATLRIMRQLGAGVEMAVPAWLLPIAKEEGFSEARESKGSCELTIRGRGFSGLKAAGADLDCGNSGTTARLLTGLLAGRPFASTLTGDDSLRRRPFKRVTDPLSKMGASFSGDMLPLTITGGNLSGISYDSPKASAQVKSAVVLAGLQASGSTKVTEPSLSRDHTERMLRAMGVDLVSSEDEKGRPTIEVKGGVSALRPLDIDIPGDFSSAAFLLVGASVIPDSKVVLKNVGYNPTRRGLADLLLRMGASIKTLATREVGGEIVVDLEVTTAELHGIEVTAQDVVLAIDEIPALCVAASVARGTTVISGAEELRVKESDRLAMMAAELRAFGVSVEERPDGMIVQGGGQLSYHHTQGADPVSWQMSGDHRIAMCGALLELLATQSFTLHDVHAVETSFPSFVDIFERLTR